MMKTEFNLVFLDNWPPVLLGMMRQELPSFPASDCFRMDVQLSSFSFPLTLTCLPAPVGKKHPHRLMPDHQDPLKGWMGEMSGTGLTQTQSWDLGP